MKISTGFPIDFSSRALYGVVFGVMVLCTVLLYFSFGLTIKMPAAVLFSLWLIVLAIIDFKTHILPDKITISGIWLGLFFNLFNLFCSITLAVWGVIFGYGLLWCIAYLYAWIKKRPGMGHGDFKMLACVGAWLGPVYVLSTLIFAVTLSLITALILLNFKKIKYDDFIPFGPFLAIGGLISLLVGQKITYWLVGF